MTNSVAFKIIAIDGGAASGKSSAARALAERFNYMYVDTGTHYRTLTLELLRAKTSPQSARSVADTLTELHFGTELKGRHAWLSINGNIPAEADLRSPETNASVSTFAAIPEVRQFLLEYQRSQAEIARRNTFGGLIMEGRDIGSVIFPEADFRFFLYANEATRRARREKEGQIDPITVRDALDQSRKIAPLICPKGALPVDTTSLSFNDMVDCMADQINTGN